jgi:hypothetical protein
MDGWMDDALGSRHNFSFQSTNDARDKKEKERHYYSGHWNCKGQKERVRWRLSNLQSAFSNAAIVK